jgi:hypothetical protein
MSIGFQEFDVQQFRTEIAKMSDAELLSMGRSLRSPVLMHAEQLRQILPSLWQSS